MSRRCAKRVFRDASRVGVLLWATLSFGAEAAGGRTYTDLRQAADRAWSEGAWLPALSLYRDAESVAPPNERRFVRVRRLDTTWRIAESSYNPQIRSVLSELETLGSLDRPAGRRDEAWAEAASSLAEYRVRREGFEKTWPFADQALSWWDAPGASEVSRMRYVALVLKLAVPGGLAGGPNRVPLAVLERAVQFAGAREDAIVLRFLVASALPESSSDLSRQREAWERAVSGRPASLGPDSKGRTLAAEAWFEARSRYARWLAEWGRTDPAAGAYSQRRGDRAAALEVLQALLKDLPASDVGRRAGVDRQIHELVDPVVWVSGGVFLPGSPIVLNVGGRNVAELEIAVYPLDAECDIRQQAGPPYRSWQVDVPLEERVPLLQWTQRLFEGRGSGSMNEQAVLPAPLPRGLYLVSVRNEGLEKREVIQVTDLAVAYQTDPGGLLAYVSSAETGAPFPGADVRVWSTSRKGNTVRASEERGKTGPDGLARLAIPAGSITMLEAGGGDRHLLVSYVTGGVPSRSADVLVTAIPDRSVCYAGGTVELLLVGRSMTTGRPPQPGSREMRWRLDRPGGGFEYPSPGVAEGKVTLDDEGLAHVSVPIPPMAAPGPLSIGATCIAEEGLFALMTGYRPTSLRIESRAQAPFAVTVVRRDRGPDPPPPGEVVLLELVATAKGGLPVPAAEIVVVVRGRPVWGAWNGPPGYREPSGKGTEIWRGRLVTDSAGRARASVPTGNATPQEIETDLLVRASDGGEVRTFHSFITSTEDARLDVKPRRTVFRPGEDVEIELVSRSVYGKPARIEGVLELSPAAEPVAETPDGRRVAGDELSRLRFFAPFGSANYRSVEVPPAEPVRIPFRTDGGRSVIRVRLPEGTYRVQAYSREPGRRWLGSAEARVAGRSECVLRESSGTELVVLPVAEPARRGEPLSVLVVTPVPGMWVVVTATGPELLASRTVFVRGTTQEVEVPIPRDAAAWITVTAQAVLGRRSLVRSSVLPVRSGEDELLVEIQSDPRTPAPGQEVALQVSVRDATGRPRRAKVVVSVVPEQSTDQGPAAPSPLGLPPQSAWVQAGTSLTSYSPRRFVPFDDGSFVDEAMVESKLSERKRLEELQKKPAVPPPVPPVPGPRASQALAVSTGATPPTVRSEPGLSSSVPLARGPGEIPVPASLLYQTLAGTDPDGLTRTTVRLPPAAARFRVTAFASTVEGGFGAASIPISSLTPLGVALRVPERVRAGDRLEPIVAVTNRTRETCDVSVTLSVDGKEGAGESRLETLREGETRRLAFRAREMPAGPTTFVARIAGEEGFDSEAVTVRGEPEEGERAGVTVAGLASASLSLPGPAAGTSVLLRLAELSREGLRAAVREEGGGGIREGTPEEILASALAAAVLRPPSEGANLERAEAEFAFARVLDLQQPDGGFAPFPGAPSDPELTARVLALLGRAERDGLLEPGKRQESSARFLSSRAGCLRGLARVRAVRVLAGEHARGKKTRIAEPEGLAFDEAYAGRAALGPAALALLCEAARLYGALSTADRLEEEFRRAAGEGPSGTMDTEEVAGVAEALREREAGEALARRWLSSLQSLWKGRGWGHPRATFAAVAALAPSLPAGDAESPWPRAGEFLLLGAGTPRVVESAATRLSIPPGTDRLEIQRTCEGPGFLAAMAFRESLDISEAEGESRERLRLSRRFLTEDGEAPASFEVGDAIVDVLRIDTPRASGPVRVVVPHCPAFEATERPPVLVSTTGVTPEFAFRDEREGLVIEMVLPRAGSWELRQSIRAGYAGRFHARAARLSSLSGPDPAVEGGAAGILVELSKP